ELRRFHPRLPVVIFSSLTARAAAATLDALALGANDYVTKPRGGSFEASLRHAREELVPRLRALCAPRHLAGAPPAGAPAGSAPIARVRRGGRPSHVEVVAIATSTGGPNALAAILPQLPADFPVPSLTAQHP